MLSTCQTTLSPFESPVSTESRLSIPVLAHPAMFDLTKRFRSARFRKGQPNLLFSLDNIKGAKPLRQSGFAPFCTNLLLSNQSHPDHTIHAIREISGNGKCGRRDVPGVDLQDLAHKRVEAYLNGTVKTFTYDRYTITSGHMTYMDTQIEFPEHLNASVAYLLTARCSYGADVPSLELMVRYLVTEFADETFVVNNVKISYSARLSGRAVLRHCPRNS